VAKEWEVAADDMPILDAAFWFEGREITGTVMGARTVTMDKGQGVMFLLALSAPVSIGDESVEEVEIGNLTGFRMWIDKLRREQGFDGLRKGDIVTLRCIGVTKAKKVGYSDSPRFAGKIVRP
jgi:hypothetical protein